ncbi:hypothetical protein [Gemmiger sp. An120]|nr:hypothetical protein [Gemmiger sp. An120]
MFILSVLRLCVWLYDIRAALADGRLPETAARQSAARLIALASALRGG